MTIESYGGPPPVMHEGVKCDGCGETPLRGTRRRCLLCLDADFCPQCCDHHRHDAFIVLPKPAHAAWSETLQLMTCFGALAGADEFDGRDGLNAPPPPGLNDRLRAFINQGAHAICPPGPALCPMVNPASHLERLARSRRIAHVREDARRRVREADSRNERSSHVFIGSDGWQNERRMDAKGLPPTRSRSVHLPCNRQSAAATGLKS